MFFIDYTFIHKYTNTYILYLYIYIYIYIYIYVRILSIFENGFDIFLRVNYQFIILD